MRGLRPVAASSALAWWRGLPLAVRVGVLTLVSLVALAPAWRLYGAWWDLWNGVGTFYDRWLPAVAR